MSSVSKKVAVSDTPAAAAERAVPGLFRGLAFQTAEAQARASAATSS